MNGAVPGITGIVNQDVEPAEFLQRGLDDSFWEGRVRHIAAEGKGFGSGFPNGGDRLLHRLGIHIRQNHPSPVRGKQLGRSPANPPPRAVMRAIFPSSSLITIFFPSTGSSEQS